MRKLLFALPMTLFLTSCTGEDVNSFTVKVIDGAIKACDWVPSVATVAALFNQGEVKIVTDAITIICDLRTRPGAMAGAVPSYKGIPITGYSIKK